MFDQENLHQNARARRALFFVLVILSTAAATYLMLDVVQANGTTIVEMITTVLFTINFACIAAAFWTASIGFILRLSGRDPIALRALAREDGSTIEISTRTTVVMPIYNEDPTRVFAGLEATYRSLSQTGALGHFDFFVLSDTRANDIAVAEESAWASLCARVDAAGRIFYRRRQHNTERKAGNLSDFCRQWGRDYEHMIVLDADSVMAGDTLVRLVRLMQANPTAGIIQTLPLPANRESFFARFVQYACRLNGPLLATGLSFWHLGESNYWGHNAIIRIAPFMEHCGLPHLSGRAPFGGEILSHDFVEAALILRGGWSVWLVPEALGSYEEVPSNLVDYAKRDRRWCQGNLQHLKLLTAQGLRPLSRLHLLMGVMAYVSPLLWFALLALSTFEIIEQGLFKHEYFLPGRSLFPVWPVSKSFEQISLYGVTMGVLLLPKFYALVLTLADSKERAAYGGAWALMKSAVVEFFFSVLIAPVMMLFHSHFVVSILAGRSVNWGNQARSDRGLRWMEAAARHWFHTLIGLIWAAAIIAIAPRYFGWLLPVFLGMILSIPLAVASSRADLGALFRRWKIFLTPEETEPPQIWRDVHLAMAAAEARAAAGEFPTPPMNLVRVPPVRPAEMRPQSLHQAPESRNAWTVSDLRTR